MVCAQTNTATNLIEPKMWPLLWMEWQEILHEAGHPHLARARGWPGSASGTEQTGGDVRGPGAEQGPGLPGPSLHQREGPGPRDSQKLGLSRYDLDRRIAAR